MKYLLADADARKRNNPSLKVPSLEDRQSLEVGQRVKLYADEKEHIWAIIAEVRPEGGYVGKVESIPQVLAGLNKDDLIDFEARHILAIR